MTSESTRAHDPQVFTGFFSLGSTDDVRSTGRRTEVPGSRRRGEEEEVRFRLKGANFHLESEIKIKI